VSNGRAGTEVEPDHQRHADHKADAKGTGRAPHPVPFTDEHPSVCACDVETEEEHERRVQRRTKPLEPNARDRTSAYGRNGASLLGRLPHPRQMGFLLMAVRDPGASSVTPHHRGQSWFSHRHTLRPRPSPIRRFGRLRIGFAIDAPMLTPAAASPHLPSSDTPSGPQPTFSRIARCPGPLYVAYHSLGESLAKVWATPNPFIAKSQRSNVNDKIS
jgi:hypothetical protein